MPTEFLSPGLTIALTAYAIGVASPGPSNMAIMATAMSQGRQYAWHLQRELFVVQSHGTCLPHSGYPLS